MKKSSLHHYGKAPGFRDNVTEAPRGRPTNFIEPPRWALNTIASAGKRTPDHPKQQSWSGYPYGADSNYQSVNYERQRRKHEKAQRRQQKQAARKVVPRGSLPREDDYRFYYGHIQESYGLAGGCRWCGKWIHNIHLLREHFKENECNGRILAVYKFLAHQTPKKCVVCNKPTPSSRWGTPICATVDCLKSWKFDWPEKWHGWRVARVAALALGVVTEKGEFPSEISRSI